MALDNDRISPRETVVVLVVLVAGMDTPNSRFISQSVSHQRESRSFQRGRRPNTDIARKEL